MIDFDELKNLIDPRKNPEREYFLDLLDGDKQIEYENKHIDAVMKMLRIVRLGKLKARFNSAKQEREELTRSEDYNAEKYAKVLQINAEICGLKKKMEEFKPLFEEPYFARMDLTDREDG